MQILDASWHSFQIALSTCCCLAHGNQSCNHSTNWALLAALISLIFKLCNVDPIPRSNFHREGPPAGILHIYRIYGNCSTPEFWNSKGTSLQCMVSWGHFTWVQHNDISTRLNWSRKVRMLYLDTGHTVDFFSFFLFSSWPRISPICLFEEDSFAYPQFEGMRTKSLHCYF